LEYSAALAVYRVCHNSGGDEVIRMQDDHVLRVVHNALARYIEVADQVNVRVFTAGRVEPGFAQHNDLAASGLLVLDE
jgi:hypothetical protein